MNKLVFESLNELNNFEKNKDSLNSLNIGRYKFIKSWLDEMEIGNYTINDDLTIDVNGNVWINNRDLTELPNYIKFNDILGSFFCYENKLISLKGCPNKVAGGFSCHSNQLTSLEGCPKLVENGGFICNHNLLTSLIGCPIMINYNFYCDNNQLANLEGCPILVKGNFNCSNNKVKFTYDYIKNLCEVENKIYL